MYPSHWAVLRGPQSPAGIALSVQQRRALPARLTQQIQLTMQNRIISPALQATRQPKPPLLFRLFDAFPLLRRVPARLLALGIRPEHVQTPDASAAA